MPDLLATSVSDMSVRDASLFGDDICASPVDWPPGVSCSHTVHSELQQASSHVYVLTLDMQSLPHYDSVASALDRMRSNSTSNAEQAPACRGVDVQSSGKRNRNVDTCSCNSMRRSTNDFHLQLMTVTSTRCVRRKFRLMSMADGDVTLCSSCKAYLPPILKRSDY